MYKKFFFNPLKNNNCRLATRNMPAGGGSTGKVRVLFFRNLYNMRIFTQLSVQ